MQKTVLTILGALLIAGSAAQTATASEHQVRKVYPARISAIQQFRAANNSSEVGANGLPNAYLEFDRRNTFN